MGTIRPGFFFWDCKGPHNQWVVIHWRKQRGDPTWRSDFWWGLSCFLRKDEDALGPKKKWVPVTNNNCLCIYIYTVQYIHTSILSGGGSSTLAHLFRNESSKKHTLGPSRRDFLMKCLEVIKEIIPHQWRIRLGQGFTGPKKRLTEGVFVFFFALRTVVHLRGLAIAIDCLDTVTKYTLRYESPLPRCWLPVSWFSWSDLRSIPTYIHISYICSNGRTWYTTVLNRDIS